MSRIAILGSGAWGTALALSLDRRGGHEITLWAHTPELARPDRQRRRKLCNSFPAFPVPPTVTVTSDCAAITAADIVVSVIPSEFLRPTILRYASALTFASGNS